MFKALLNIKVIFRSTLLLALVFSTLILLQSVSMLVATNISDFDGDVFLNGIWPSATTDHWSQSQVLWIYLLPYLVYILLLVFIEWKPKYPTKLPSWIQLLKAWSFVILLLFLFFMPLIEIITKQGIYHALNWLHIDRYLQLLLGTLLWIYFIYKSSFVASLFSTILEVPDDKPLSPKKTLIQLLSLWFIPIVIITFIVYILSDYTLSTNYIYLLSGMAFVLIINSWYINRYDVIVK